MNPRKYGYLLLQLGAGLNRGAVDSAVLQAMEEISDRLSIDVWTWRLYTDSEPREWAQRRIFFSCPDRVRDDNYAEWLAENVLMMAEILYGPMFEFTEEYLAFPFSHARCSGSTGLDCSLLIAEIDAVVDQSERFLLDTMILSHRSIRDDIVASSLRGAPLLDSKSPMRNAAAFFVEAQRDFYVYLGQLREAVYDDDWSPTKATELARWETSFQSSYKAIEAVVGDPSGDERRFRRALRDKRIDPDEEVGYRTKQKISDVIRAMNHIRDRRAAHGSTPRRGICLHEMVEFQECARYVLKCALEDAYGTQFF